MKLCMQSAYCKTRHWRKTRLFGWRGNGGIGRKQGGEEGSGSGGGRFHVAPCGVSAQLPPASAESSLPRPGFLPAAAARPRVSRQSSAGHESGKLSDSLGDAPAARSAPETRPQPPRRAFKTGSVLFLVCFAGSRPPGKLRSPVLNLRPLAHRGTPPSEPAQR